MTKSAIAFLTVAVPLLSLYAGLAAACDDPQIPPPKTNNLWYCNNSSDTVFVFVHGIMSDSGSAWRHENGAYWPKIILDDARFDSPSIYLGGFHTAVESGSYDMRAAANELFRSLSLPDSQGNAPVLEKQSIVFVTHSTGGIVVRHMLTRHIEDFKEKKVGLALIASPSLGSKDAGRLSFLLKWANNRMGQELEWDNAFLRELDRDFKNLVDQESIASLTGVEILETRFIVTGFIFNREEVVTEASGARYFGEPKMIGGADHFTVVKPANSNASVHLELLQFYLQKFQQAAGPACQPPSRFKVRFVAQTPSSSPISPKLSEISERDKPTMVVVEQVDEAKFGPTRSQHVAKQTDHFRYSPDGHFPCPGNRYTAKFSRMALAGESRVEAGSYTHETKLCFVRSSSRPSEAFAQIICNEGMSCMAGDSPGLAESCSSVSSKVSWSLFAEAHAQSAATGLRWIAPSLQALYAMDADATPGFTEFEIRSDPLRNSEHYKAMSYSVRVNGVPLFFDGLEPHSIRSRFDPASGIALRFAIENLGFTGGQDGYETIEVNLRFYDDSEVLRNETVSRQYESYRHTRPPEQFELSRGERLRWIGKYQPGSRDDRYEIMLASARLPGLQRLKREIEKVQVTLSDSSRVVGVLRPPRTENPVYGLAFGLAFPSGQVKSSFDRATALALCGWLLGKTAQGPYTVPDVRGGDISGLRERMRPDMYLYHFRPENFTESNDRGKYAGACAHQTLASAH